MKNYIRFLMLTMLSASAFVQSATVTFNFNGNLAPTITGTDVDVSSTNISLEVTDSSKTGFTTSTPQADGTEYAFLRANSIVGPSDDDYLGFTVNANTGSFTLSGASFQARTDKEFNFALRSDVDSFSSDLFTGGTTSNTWNTFTNTSITGVSNQTSTDFRLYVWDNDSATSGSDVHRIDNLTLTVIPEPSTMALFGLAGVAMLVAKCRKR